MLARKEEQGVNAPKSRGYDPKPDDLALGKVKQ